MTFTKTNNRTFSKSFPTVLDSIFNDFEKSLGQPGFSSSVPANVVETADAFHLELSAPGRNKNNFALQLEQGTLIIGYNANPSEGQPELKYVRKEFDQASFKRSFSLDDKVDTENIQAKYEDGLLKILLPKKAEVKPSVHQITIQ